MPAPCHSAVVSTRPRWQLTKTRRQSRNLAITWGAFAAACWILLTLGEDAWWQWATAASWTFLAVLHLIAWRRWQPDWDEGP